MMRGIYMAAGGMLSQQVVMNTASNNLANSETRAYKKDIALMSPFQQQLMYHLESSKELNRASIGTMPFGVEVTGSEIIYKQGSLQWTGNPLDFAIDGDGFFAVQAPDGIRLTRSGSFKVDDQNYLVTGQGYRVLGENSFIVVSGNDFVISEDGTVTEGGIQIGKLSLLDFEDRSAIRKEGDGLFSAPDDLRPIASQAKIRQGYLETSNVDVAKEMSNLIVAFRSYEANSRVFQAFDQIMQLAVQNVGNLK